MAWHFDTMTEKPDHDKQNQTTVLDDPTRLTVSVSEAARLLGIAVSTAHGAYNRTGELIPGVPVLRAGRRCIVSTAALRAALSMPEPAR